MGSIKRISENIEHAVLVGVILPDNTEGGINEQLVELELLADTAGAKTIDIFIQKRSKIDPATYIGKGKLQQIINAAISLNSQIIIFNDELSPTLLKNIQKLAGEEIKVIDRTGLILDIFDKHAQTREAKTQVQLARLEYMLPRLTRQWTHLERQMGGLGTRGGPGETQIEIDRRLVRKQINKLKYDLKKIEKQRETQSQGRKSIFKVAIVGYTNAGKSTLMNAVSGAKVYIQDQLFATLDTTTRQVKLDDGTKFLLSDTVGFIRKLPHDLIATFRSTLAEVTDADLILKVLDASSSQLMEQNKTLEEVLESMDLSQKQYLTVLNKIDLVDNPQVIDGLKRNYPDAISVSAQRQLKIESLINAIKNHITVIYIKKSIFIPFIRSNYIDNIYNELLVTGRKDDYDGVYLEVEGPLESILKFESKLK